MHFMQRGEKLKKQCTKMWNLPLACLVVVCFSDFSCSQDIRMPPSITKGPSQPIIIYRSDDRVTLECKGNGVPDVTYEWKKNGFELNLNGQNIRMGADGTITIESATSMDEGVYQCFARNRYGTALSNTTHIRKAFIHVTSGSPSVIRKVVHEGSPFYIQADSRRSYPEPTYGWEIATDMADINPVSLRPSRRIQIAENGDIHFAYARPEDDLSGRMYKLIMYNPYLDVKLGGSYTKLTVTRNSTGLTPFAPTLGFSSESVTVAIVGRSVTLRCFFYGNPEPAISWKGPRNTLPIGRYRLNQFNTEFTINGVTLADEGDYICDGTNFHGSDGKALLHIRVEAVPRFRTIEDGPHNVNVTEGESVTFNCKADAKPEAEIVWFQNGQRLDPDYSPKRLVFSNDKKSLTIRDVCRDCGDRETKTDLMVIQCNASNVHGYAFAQGYLNVLSRTIVTIQDATEVEVNENEEGRVQFDCFATSDPSTSPTIRWYKVTTEGDEVVHNDPPFVTVNGGLLSIHVAANAPLVWPRYLGQYRCVAETKHSKVTRTANITAIPIVPNVPTAIDGVPPSITKGPSKQTVIYRSDDAVTLECRGKGVPDVTYEWRKNGFELNLNLNNIHKGEDGTITIEPTTALDEGFYQCLAKNKYGAALSNTTHIQKAILDSVIPTILQKTVEAGQPFHIQAHARKSFPKPIYNWFMANVILDINPLPLRTSRRIQIADNGDLHFAYALPEDALGGRFYKSIIFNPVLDISMGGSYTNLTVNGGPTGLTRFAPTLAFASDSVTVAVVGGSATLRCFFYGDLEPVISWTGPRNTLPIGRYTLTLFNTQLTITDVKASDEGDYECRGSNDQGRRSHTLQIRVAAVPAFIKATDGPLDVNATEGSSVRFSCNARAKPEAEIVWFRNGEVLDPANPPKRFAFSGDLKSLTIRDVCRDCVDRETKTDLMVIQCNASNEHGYAFAQGYLNVLKKVPDVRNVTRNNTGKTIQMTTVLTYLKYAYMANRVLPESRLRALSGVIYEARPYVSRNFVTVIRRKIPKIFAAGKFSVVVFDSTKANSISGAMNISFQKAEHRSPCVLLVDNMDLLYPKSSAGELEGRLNVEKLLQGAAETFRNAFVLFIGFVADLDNLNPALIESGLFTID